MTGPAFLEPLPEGFATTVAALHRVAEQIVAPARKPYNEISLRVTPNGFGTPLFEFGGAEHQVRVEGVELVHQEGTAERRAPLTSLVSAAEAVAGLLPAGTELDHQPLTVDPLAARALADWYALADELLGELADAAEDDEETTRPRLWPEHFDVAIELGSEPDGRRANYGASPGDADHPEPYLYVGPWTAPVSGELWRATGFTGAELGYAELLAAGDPGAAARRFFITRKAALTEHGKDEETK